MKKPRARALALVLLLGGSAPADPTHRGVLLLPATCLSEPIDRSAFVDALRVELGATEFAIETADGPAAPLLLALETDGCGSDAPVIRIVATNRLTGRKVERTVSVLDLPVAARPRTAALATAEAISDAWTEPVPPGTPPSGSPPAPALPPRDARETAPTPPPAEPHDKVSTLLGAAVEYRTYPSEGTALVGGRLFSAWALSGSSLEVRGDVALAQGTRDVTLGTVTTRTAAGAIGVARVVDASSLVLTMGPMLEVGYAHVEGSPRSGVSGASGGAPLVALLLDIGVRARWTSLHAVAEIAGGVEAAGVRARADDDVVATAAGVLVEVRAGLGWSP